MTLKFKISLFISLLFTVLFGAAALIIITLFSDFRQDEFQQRLEEKALTSVKLLADVQEVDKQLLKVIDKNTINLLYNEKTLVFDSGFNLVYSSLDDTRINWTKEDLQYLNKHDKFFKEEGENEIFGVHYTSAGINYYALISADDTNGKRKLKYLVYLVGVTYAVLTAMAWILCFYTTKRLLSPLDTFQRKISQINEHNLDTRFPVQDGTTGRQNEINLLAKEFNFLLERIADAYQKQKEFTAHASHELRTPLARISAQLENRLLTVEEQDKPFVVATLQNINQLNSLINSLLILSTVENKKAGGIEALRLDEIIYKSIEKLHAEAPGFKAVLEMQEAGLTEEQLMVQGNPFLLETVFYNLFKNAFRYSSNGQATITINASAKPVKVVVSNDGATLSQEEQKKLFQPFMRGANARQASGLGLGLRIVQRILHYYGYSIQYQVINGQNVFILSF